MSYGSTYACNAKHQADTMFVYTMSISSQTALSTSTRRLAAHIVHALTIHPREVQTMWWHNHDAGSYQTLCEVDSSSGDVVFTGLWQVHTLYQIDSSMMSTRIKQIWYLVKHGVFRIKPLFKQVFFDFQHTQRPRWLFILGRYSSMIA